MNDNSIAILTERMPYYPGST